MKNYEEMSDFEINKLISEILLNDKKHLSTWISSNEMLGKVWLVDESNGNKAIEFDPCNCHDDAYPIMESYGMAISIDGRASIPKSTSETRCSISHHCEKSILRAAMICFLKMKDA